MEISTRTQGDFQQTKKNKPKTNGSRVVSITDIEEEALLCANGDNRQDSSHVIVNDKNVLENRSAEVQKSIPEGESSTYGKLQTSRVSEAGTRHTMKKGHFLTGSVQLTFKWW